MKRLLVILVLTVAACVLAACGGETEAGPEPASASIEQQAADEELSAGERSDLMAGYHYCKARGRDNLIETFGLNPGASEIDIAMKVARMQRWSKFDVGYVSVGCTEALDEGTG